MTDEWNACEDRQPSRSRLYNNHEPGDACTRVMEIRSEENGIYTRRLGELVLRGNLEGTLTCELHEEPEWR